MHYRLASLLLASTALAAPSLKFSRRQYGSSVASPYPTPVGSYGYGTPTPTPYYDSPAYEESLSALETLTPATDMEIALVSYVCGAYYDAVYSYDDSESEDESPYSESSSDSYRKSRRQEGEYGSDEGESEETEYEVEEVETELSYAAEIESALIDVLCSNMEAYYAAEEQFDNGFGEEESEYKRKRSAKAPRFQSKRLVKAKKAVGKNKMMQRRAGKAARKAARKSVKSRV